MASGKSKDLSKETAQYLKIKVYNQILNELQAAVSPGGGLPNDVRDNIIAHKKEMEQIIKKLKENPYFQEVMIRAFKNIKADTRDTAEVQREQVFCAALDMAKITAPNYKAEIVAGLEKLPDEPKLSEDARILWDIVLPALLLEPAPEVLSELAEALGTTADLLSKAGSMAREKETAELLPGCEPTREERINQALEVIQQNKIIYSLITKRGTSRVERKTGYIANTRDNELTLALDIREDEKIEKSKDIVRVKWNAPYNVHGEQLRVTAFDQIIEKVISNFYDEGHPAITTEQIYYAMTGQDSRQGKPHKQILTAIESSIEKLNTIPVSIRRIENGKAKEDESGNITVEGGEVTIIAEYSTILDTAKTDYIKIQGVNRPGWISSRLGHLYHTEKALGRLISTDRETLNISAGGISFTELSFTLREFCLLEIARFATTADYSIDKNKFLLDSMYLYEADPALVEIAPNMARKIRQGKTPSEQSIIRTMKKRRKELLQKLLQHFKAKGKIKGWDFCKGKQKLPYTIDKDNPSHRIYKGSFDSVYIQVEKKGRAIDTIAAIERRLETAERNRRRANKKDEQK